MFAEASMEVVLNGREATFRFSPPLVVMLVYVYDDRGELTWRMMASDVSSSQGTFAAVPITEAPPELPILPSSDRAIAASLEPAPERPPLASVRYGVVPEGYRQERSASPLSPGGYDVFVIAKSARAEAHFDVPNA